MASKKLYRVKRSQIDVVPKIMGTRYPELSFRKGYVFIQQKGSQDVFMISSTSTKKSLKIDLVNAEIVEEDGD